MGEVEGDVELAVGCVCVVDVEVFEPVEGEMG